MKIIILNKIKIKFLSFEASQHERNGSATGTVCIRGLAQVALHEQLLERLTASLTPRFTLIKVSAMKYREL